jgi:hypothetical protein
MAKISACSEELHAQIRSNVEHFKCLTTNHKFWPDLGDVIGGCAGCGSSLHIPASMYPGHEELPKN